MKSLKTWMSHFQVSQDSEFFYSSQETSADPSSSGSESVIVTLRILRKYQNPVTDRSSVPGPGLRLCTCETTPDRGFSEQGNCETTPDRVFLEQGHFESTPDRGFLGGSDNGRSRYTGHLD